MTISESTEMIEILNTPHEILDKENAKKLTIIDWKIAFEKVFFSYGWKQKLFSNLSFEIQPLEKIAFVGESWTFDIDKWKILIDGQSITEVTQETLRENISIVPQDPILFHRSLKENIRYGKPNATEEEILKASKIARCHDFVMKLEKWYDTFVGERWMKLSWGERQRIAIARAILENKKILVLDEATSSLDSKSEKFIQEAIQEVMKNKNCIVIAHRLSTIMKMDRITVIGNKGVKKLTEKNEETKSDSIDSFCKVEDCESYYISEEGTHDELLKKNWIYRKLWDIQSGGFIV